MKKKLVTITLALMCLSFVACSKDNTTKDEATTEVANTENSITTEEAKENTPEENSLVETESNTNELEPSKETTEAASETASSTTSNNKNLEQMQTLQDLIKNFSDDDLAELLAQAKSYEEEGNLPGALEKYLVISFYGRTPSEMEEFSTNNFDQIQNFLQTEEGMQEIMEIMQNEDPEAYDILNEQLNRYVKKAKRATDISNAATIASAFMSDFADNKIAESVSERTMLTADTLPSSLTEVPEVKSIVGANYFYTLDAEKLAVVIYINDIEVYPDSSSFMAFD